MDVTANAPTIGVIVGILGLIMPIWLRVVDYVIHRLRRWRQVVNIRNLVAHGVSQVLNSDKENLPFKSGALGSVGRPLDQTQKRIESARLGYFKTMGLHLQLAIEDFSNDLNHEQKRDVKRYLAFQQELIEKWGKTYSQVPPIDVYKEFFIPHLKMIKWLKLDTEKLVKTNQSYL